MIALNSCRVGGVAQLGERRVRNAEVVSSILILSTNHSPSFRAARRRPDVAGPVR